MLDGTQLRDATWEKDVHRTHSPLWHQNAVCTVSTEMNRSLLLLKVESFPTAGVWPLAPEEELKGFSEKSESINTKLEYAFSPHYPPANHHR